MRKVIYQYWIHSVNNDPATGKFSEPQSGYFHGWGFQVHEDSTSIVMESVALIEDITSGIMHNVDVSKVRFVQPPDTRQHKSEVKLAGDPIPGDVLKLLVPILESINKKLDSL